MSELVTSMREQIRIGVDTGGTFTDFVILKGGKRSTFKVPSTPEEPERAILEGLERAVAEIMTDADRISEVVHGTTVGTNALLERKGARAALVTTAGFEDVLEIGRQARPEPYNLSVTRAAPLIPRHLRFGVRERVLADGSIRMELEPGEVSRLFGLLRRARVESVAVSLLFSFINPVHEEQLEKELSNLGIPISISHRILPEHREYERISTLSINASLAPRMGRYLTRLRAGIEEYGAGTGLRVMQSSGGSISADVAGREPVRTILSGPAGGLVAATRVASQAGFERIITFDMGGTSTDVAVCEGEPQTTNEARIAGLPVAVPVLDIHTVGAGGGSIARLDAGGALRVGPESAGAVPGPAAYGRGELPTVTDANLLLGRFAGLGLLNGEMSLDAGRARLAFERLAGEMEAVGRKPVTVEEAALGVLSVANANMERALRLVSVEHGHDPRLFTLVGFGGGGGLHAVTLAAALRIPRVLIPVDPGAFSALGVLLADVIRDYSKTVMLTIEPGVGRTGIGSLAENFSVLEELARLELGGEGFSGDRLRLDRFYAIRYRGQSYELVISAGGDPVESFHRQHRDRFGHSDEQRSVEVVSVRLRAVGVTVKPDLRSTGSSRRGQRSQGAPSLVPTPFTTNRVWFGPRPSRVPVFKRSELHPGMHLLGPAIVVEYGSTTLIPASWGLTVDRQSNLLLTQG